MAEQTLFGGHRGIVMPGRVHDPLARRNVLILLRLTKVSINTTT
jgi:hypothetical protein